MMVKAPPFSHEHKGLIVDALLSVIEDKMSRRIKLERRELLKLQECIKIVDNWKGDTE